MPTPSSASSSAALASPTSGHRPRSRSTSRRWGSGTVQAANKEAEEVAFDVLGGMCPECEGTGSVKDIDLSELYDENLSLEEGAIKAPGYTPDGWPVRIYAASGFLDPAKPIKDYTETELHDFLYKEQTKVRIQGTNVT